MRRQDLDRHLKEVGEEVSSMHTKKRIPKNALLKLNTQIKIIAEKCGEFEDFRLRKANIGPQDGNFIQQGCVLFIGWCLDGIAGERQSPTAGGLPKSVEATSQYGRRQGKSQERREPLRGTCDDVTPQQQGAGLWVRELTRATALGSLVTTRSVSYTASRYCA